MTQDAVSYDRYSYLDGSYDTAINDSYDARITDRVESGANQMAEDLEHQFFVGLQNVLSSARSSAVAVATTPHVTQGRLFAEFSEIPFSICSCLETCDMSCWNKLLHEARRVV